MEEKVALVTGGSRGIGKSISLALSRSGFYVAINYRRNESEAQRLLEEIEAEGHKGLLVQCDVTDYAQCKAMVKNILDCFGRVDVLVNNAGIRADNLLVRMKEEEWESVINTNLRGVYNCTRSVIRPLLRQKSGGRVINITSIAGIYGNAGQSNYGAAKAGVIGFTKSLAKELGGRNITVNAIAPGFIETEMTGALSDNLKEEVRSRVPLGRFGKPEEIAEVVVFLATRASYITGEVISVDGGLVI